MQEKVSEPAAAAPEASADLDTVGGETFIATSLTGRFLKRSALSFDQTGLRPAVTLEFNDEGAAMLADITKKRIGEPLAIYLDGIPIQVATVQEEITTGNAQISGSFSAEEARNLVRALNSGALPLPITLIAEQRVGALLGHEALARGLRAGIYGIIAVAIFMLAWYRFSGMLATAALGLYGALILALFQLIPVTLTAAGIAGFILSIGMAVDANILIFERSREELAVGKSLHNAIREGFSRAWPAIRDSNITTLISAAILFQFGTSIVRGFALTLGIGVLLSMFTAISATRLFLLACAHRGQGGAWWFNRPRAADHAHI